MPTSRYHSHLGARPDAHISLLPSVQSPGATSPAVPGANATSSEDGKGPTCYASPDVLANHIFVSFTFCIFRHRRVRGPRVRSSSTLLRCLSASSCFGLRLHLSSRSWTCAVNGAVILSCKRSCTPFCIRVAIRLRPAMESDFRLALSIVTWLPVALCEMKIVHTQTGTGANTLTSFANGAFKFVFRSHWQSVLGLSAVSTWPKTSSTLAKLHSQNFAFELKVPRTAPSLKPQRTLNPKADSKAHTFLPGCLGRWHFPRALRCT